VSNGDPIKAGEQNFATTGTSLFPDYGWDGSSPMFFMGDAVNRGGDSASANNVDCLITRAAESILKDGRLAN
jgi:hypothetical protein